MKEAVVLEAASTEQSVKGVHGLVTRYGLGARSIDIWGTLRGHVTSGFFYFYQILVPAKL